MSAMIAPSSVHDINTTACLIKVGTHSDHAPSKRVYKFWCRLRLNCFLN